MALVLPYPDLDFVPLDILTAEEMNQIVANYTHIANQFPVTSQNIDWATLIPRAECLYQLGNQSASQFKITVTGNEQYENVYGLLCFRQAPPKLITIYLGQPNTITNVYVNDSTKLSWTADGNVLTVTYADVWSDCAFLYLKKRTGTTVTLGR